MAWRLCNSLERLEIDNRSPGKITGLLWLNGRSDPISLDLVGNALRDIAGCKVVITNPESEPGEYLDLFEHQTGVAGDMTASRKLRVFDVPVEEAYRMKKRGELPPEHIANGVFIEWYSERNGRVVIEGTEFNISVSDKRWAMSLEEEIEQQQRNLDAIDDWMAMLGQSLAGRFEEEEKAEEANFNEFGGAPEEIDNEILFDDSHPMNEFDWERQLKESDKLTSKFSKLMEEYIDHPDRDNIIAQKMGWSWREETTGAGNESQPLPHPAFDDIDFDSLPELIPNPKTEGIDWIRREDGEVTHPLTDFAFRTAMDMWHYCNEENLTNNIDPDLQCMLFQAQNLSAKLAGALNGLAYDTHVEGGFIVACLKRALTYFNESSAAVSKVEQKKLIHPEILRDFRTHLHEIRQEILELMDRFRTAL